MAITRNARTDVDMAHAIYEWIVENTYRKRNTRLRHREGSIHAAVQRPPRQMRRSERAFRCARASGRTRARDVYGIRVAKSEMRYNSLGASSDNVTKAQHCRAEVHLSAYGWVPVDPADVRKGDARRTAGTRPVHDEMVKKARARRFGSWEMNWMAYNFAHDVALPGSSGPPLGVFMYPKAETAHGRLDSLAPDDFKYEITSRKLCPSWGLSEKLMDYVPPTIAQRPKLSRA